MLGFSGEKKQCVCVWSRHSQHSCLYCSFVLKRMEYHILLKNMAYDTSKFIEWCRRCAYTAIIQLIGRFNATKNVYCYIEYLREATLLSKGEETVFSKVYNYLSKTKQNEWSVQKNNNYEYKIIYFNLMRCFKRYNWL